MLYSFEGKSPQVHPSAFVAENATIIGDVVLEANTSVWFGVVIRGDGGPVRIGEGTNLQDNMVIHDQVTIGKFCTVGHGAIIHGCQIGDRCLVGAGSIVFDDCKVGNDCIIGAGAVLPPRTQVPDGTLMLGVPAKPVRQLSPRELEGRARGAEGYMRRSKMYMDPSVFYAIDTKARVQQ